MTCAADDVAIHSQGEREQSLDLVIIDTFEHLIRHETRRQCQPDRSPTSLTKSIPTVPTEIESATVALPWAPA